jgi:AcrR family transcriptional regulator
MDDVAAACGVTKLILYRHFESKEELYREILEQVFHRLGEELEAQLAQPGHPGLGPRTLLTVAREDPSAFFLLWRHASREPGFGAYAEDLRAVAVTVVRRLMAIDSGDECFDAWRAETLFAWLVEAILSWLERGDPQRDEEFVQRTSAGLRALRDALLRTDPMMPIVDAVQGSQRDGEVR